MTELESIMQAGIGDMVAGAGVSTCTIGVTVVTGVYSPGEKSAELGIGGMVNPSPAEFVYQSSAASAPSLLSVVVVSGEKKRVMGVTEDSGLTSITLADPEDVRR